MLVLPALEELAIKDFACECCALVGFQKRDRKEFKKYELDEVVVGGCGELIACGPY